MGVTASVQDEWEENILNTKNNQRLDSLGIILQRESKTFSHECNFLLRKAYSHVSLKLFQKLLAEDLIMANSAVYSKQVQLYSTCTF